MKNPPLSKCLIVGSLIATSCTPQSLSADETRDKNVLFIVVDDLITTLGSYGHKVVKTPNIDRLARIGVKFNHAFCNYAVSNPSRSSFLT